MAERPRSRVGALVDIQAARRQSIIEKLIRALLGLWISFDRWEDDDLVRITAAQSLRYVEQALREARRTAHAYELGTLREIDAMPEELPEVEYIYPRSLADMLEVYERPAKQYRWELVKGKTPLEALESLEHRIEEIVDIDVAAVSRDEQQRVMRSSAKVIGYRRIIHPELSRTGTCGLCVVAATNFYSIDDLAPLHDRCKCETLSVTTELDPGLRLNRDDLDRIYRDAADSDQSTGTSAEELKRIRVEINEHGELGPILTRQGHHFRGPEEVGRPRYSPPTAEENRQKLEGRLEKVSLTLDSVIARRNGGDLNKYLIDAERQARETVRVIEQQLASAA
jgi:hypothetical protein